MMQFSMHHVHIRYPKTAMKSSLISFQTNKTNVCYEKFLNMFLVYIYYYFDCVSLVLAASNEYLRLIQKLIKVKDFPYNLFCTNH